MPYCYLLPKVYLDHQSMMEHQFIEEPQPPQHLRCSLVFSDKTCDIIPLHAPSLFNYHVRHGYRIMPKDITTYRNELTAAEAEAQAWDAQVPQQKHFPGPDGYYQWGSPS